MRPQQKFATSKPQTFRKHRFADTTSAKSSQRRVFAKNNAVVVNFCELFEGFLRGYP